MEAVVVVQPTPSPAPAVKVTLTADPYEAAVLRTLLLSGKIRQSVLSQKTKELLVQEKQMPEGHLEVVGGRTPEWVKATKDEIDKCQQRGWIKKEAEELQLTPDGRRTANAYQQAVNA